MSKGIPKNGINKGWFKKGYVSSETIREKLKNNKNNLGKHWKIEDTSKMSHVAWNRGLTKNTDERVMKIGINSSISRKGKQSNVLGKHWKIKDTTKMSEAKKGDKNPTKRSDVKKKLKEWHVNHPNKKFSNTKIEQKIAIELSKRGIAFLQNIGLDNIANVDFYLPDSNTVIECDGCFYHNCLEHYPACHQEARERDENKTNILKSHDYKVFRFWEHEINRSPELCLNKISL